MLRGVATQRCAARGGRDMLNLEISGARIPRADLRGLSLTLENPVVLLFIYILFWGCFVCLLRILLALGVASHPPRQALQAAMGTSQPPGLNNLVEFERRSNRQALQQNLCCGLRIVAIRLDRPERMRGKGKAASCPKRSGGLDVRNTCTTHWLYIAIDQIGRSIAKRQRRPRIVAASDGLRWVIRTTGTGWSNQKGVGAH